MQLLHCAQGQLCPSFDSVSRLGFEAEQQSYEGQQSKLWTYHNDIAVQQQHGCSFYLGIDQCKRNTQYFAVTKRWTERRMCTICTDKCATVLVIP